MFPTWRPLSGFPAADLRALDKLTYLIENPNHHIGNVKSAAFCTFDESSDILLQQTQGFHYPHAVSFSCLHLKMTSIVPLAIFLSHHHLANKYLSDFFQMQHQAFWSRKDPIHLPLPGHGCGSAG
jgi:hypothetical protein